MRLHRVLVASIISTVALRSAASSTPAQIYAGLGPGVGRVDFVAQLHNGDTEVGTGSAFLITPDGCMLTCKHVLPVFSNYKTVALTVRLGSLQATPLPATVIWMAPQADLAILQVNAQGGTSLPLAKTSPPPGSAVVVLGYPITLDLNISGGLVSGPADQGRLVMDVAINPGNSGGPVINTDGEVVGVAWGAATTWKIGSETIPLEGIKYFVPTEMIAASAPQECPTKSTEPIDLAALSPTLIRRAYAVEFLKDDHPILLAPHRREYSRVLQAEPGYVITKVNVVALSANHGVGRDVKIAPDGKSVIFTESLESGPQLDQWRGWFSGTLELQQEKVPHP